MGCTSSSPSDRTKGAGTAKQQADAAEMAATVSKPVAASSSTILSDDYELGSVIGKGNFATVREAKNKRTGEKVAVKCIDPANLSKEDADALKIEIEVLKQLDHPNIIALLDVYFEPKQYYIVTELMSGGELFDSIVEKEYYHEHDARRVVKTMAEAIKYCHSMKVVHRDLKPENVLLSDKSDSATIKIADFGFAKKIVLDGQGENGLTTACGTPGYVAPEIINAKTYASEVDMWSLGVITYILLCGYPPFHDDNQARLFNTIRRGKFEFDSPYWDNISEEAKSFVSDLLVVDPTQRMTVEGVFKHPWMKSEVEDHDITGALGELKRFQARKRWKTGVAAVSAVAKMQKLAAVGSLSSDDVDVTEVTES